MSSGTRNLLGEVMVWALLALAAVWAISNFDDVREGARTLGLELPPATASLERKRAKEVEQARRPKPIGYVELEPNRYGHYKTPLEVNGRRIDGMVDTGATLVALSHDDARRAGLIITNRDYTHRVRTANGIAKVAPVNLSRVRIGDIVVRNVRGVVSEPGAMNGTLIGMSFLSRLSRFEIRSGRLILQE